MKKNFASVSLENGKSRKENIKRWIFIRKVSAKTVLKTILYAGKSTRKKFAIDTG